MPGRSAQVNPVPSHSAQFNAPRCSPSAPPCHHGHGYARSLWITARALAGCAGHHDRTIGSPAFASRCIQPERLDIIKT